jgi:hypothetical protein
MQKYDRPMHFAPCQRRVYSNPLPQALAGGTSDVVACMSAELVERKHQCDAPPSHCGNVAGRSICMKSTGRNPFQVFRDQWGHHEVFYERFEQVVALVLSAVIAVIIVVSLFQLISIVFTLLVLDAFNPLDHKVFQSGVRHDS